MKTTIIISLLIICSVCKGQDSLTMKVEKDSFGIYQGSTLLNKWATSAFGIAYMPYSSTAYDTVKVEMLCSSKDEQNNKVVKIIGYEVRDKNQNYASLWGGCIGCDYTHPYFVIKYLDIIKQPLTGITVWMSKEIK